jgi:hypothetical protein
MEINVSRGEHTTCTRVIAPITFCFGQAHDEYTWSIVKCELVRRSCRALIEKETVFSVS